MAGNVSGLSQEQLQFMAKDIGKQLLPFILVEDILASLGLTFEEWLATFTVEERLAGLSPAEIRRYLEQLEQGKATNGA